MRTFKILLTVFLFVFLSYSFSYARSVINFIDNTHYWPTWGNSDDNDTDTVGSPNFLGGTVTIEDGNLAGISFDVEHWNSNLEFTDLFLDTNADDTWDYVVKLYTRSHGGSTDAGNYNVYEINAPENKSVGSRYYHLSYWDNPDPSAYRQDHPIAIKGRYLGSNIGTAYFSGVPSGETSFTTSFDFSGLNISLDDEFIIAWQVQCANDIVYEKLRNPVPEPSSMLLVGLGLLAAGTWVRRRKV